jgi:hypothetical protein
VAGATSEGSFVEAGVAQTDGLVAVTVHLAPAAEQALEELALRRGVSTAQVLGEALIESKFFSDQRRSGNEVVLRLPDGRLSSVRWPHG